MSAPERRMPEKMEFTGRLAAFPAANLLQWALQERVTGTLVVRRSTSEKRVGLRSGQVTECRSNQPRELFGRFLVDHERVGVEELSGALALGRKSGHPLGRSLVELGMLSEEAVLGLLRRWMSESVQDLFLWPRGVFYFDERPPRQPALDAGVDTRELILEGTHWIDQMVRIRKLLPDDGVVLRKGTAWPGNMLAPFDSKIARAVAPESDLSTLRAAVGGVDFPFLDSVSRLLSLHVLAIDRHQPVARDSTGELRLSDLLMELEAQEAGARVRGERAIVPLDIFEGLVPVWIQPPVEGEFAGLSPSLRAFLEGFDGRSTLRRLLAPEEELQTDQIDLLLLHLRRRNLILLPSGLEEIERRLPSGGALRGVLRRLRG
ncbi:MAG TPA: DUF4388 domain-containing protein [Thermoanaerobaculia bacterium]|nr:DUF4388 domain-containing protein [Thermoanaerobaculia bacterium]